MPDTLFAYIDSTSNAVLSKGFSPNDFVDGIVHQPKHLLLLDPVAEAGEYEPHTGLKIVNGPEQVQQFFTTKTFTHSKGTKWIDFKRTDSIRNFRITLFWSHADTSAFSLFL